MNKEQVDRKLSNTFERLRRVARSVLAGAPLAKMIDAIDAEERVALRVVDDFSASRAN